MMHTAALLLSALTLPLLQDQAEDLRTAYDVEAYHFDWVVMPESKTLDGRVTVTATVTRAMETLQLDCKEKPNRTA